MKMLIKTAPLVVLVMAFTFVPAPLFSQCAGQTLQAQDQTAAAVPPVEVLGQSEMQGLLECAEWAFGISGICALGRILLRRPRVPMVLFPAGVHR